MENDKQPENITMNFPNCPKCGSGKRLANEVLLKEKAKGKMPEGANAFLFTHNSLIVKDANFLTAQMITTFYDSCTECGTTWCIHAQEQTIMQGMKQMPGGLPHNFSPS